MSYVPYVPAWCTYPCVKVPKCEKRTNFLFFTCQYAKGKPIFQLCLPKGVPIFQLFLKRIFQFSNFSIMLSICKFQEYFAILENLSRETKNLNFDISKISLRKNLISLTSFSMEHVGLSEQLFG